MYSNKYSTSFKYVSFLFVFLLLWQAEPASAQNGVTPTVTHNTEIPGPSQGWRLLGAPVSGATYADFFDGLWTQGFPGASSQSGSSSIYWYDESTRQLIKPLHANNIIGSSSDNGFENAGHAIIAYIFEDDFFDNTSVSWPKPVSVTGTPNTGDIFMSFTNTILPGDNSQGWHLISNPYPFPINWPDLVEHGGLQDMITVIFVFDANGNGGRGGYRINYGFDVRNLPADIAHDGNLAPFQGFWVRTNEVQPQGSITFKEEYETSGGSLFNAPEQPDFFAFSVAGQNNSATAVLTLNNGPEQSTSKPIPFSQEELHFGFMNEAGAGPDIFRNREMGNGDVLTIPLDFATVNSGTYTFSMSANEDMIDAEIILTDHATGLQHNFALGGTYSFEYQADQQLASMPNSASPLEIINQPELLLLSPESRFELMITYGTATSIDPGNQLPVRIELSQNYPNPFNPSTRIEYALPETAEVSLEVFNMMGQRVATLVSGQKTAGQHTAIFDGSQLSSGMYLYRLTAGRFTETRKMMLIK
ncbi:MAG: T9SS type A sorting domain-containing protein [Balneolales bacterium]|nr:T9SS type A sorting domain-containing protein [Balneolales bacterium]